MPTWKIVKSLTGAGKRRRVPFTCTCGYVATIEVIGLPIAQIGSGIVFDIGGYEMPSKIQCRKCGRVFEQEPTDVR